MDLKSCVLLAAASLALFDGSLLAQHAHVNSAPVAASHASPRLNTAAPVSNLGGRPYPFRSDIPRPTGLTAPAASYTGITRGALAPINGPGARGSHNRYGGIGYAGFYGLPLLPYNDESTYATSFPGFQEQAEAIGAQNNAQAQAAMAQRIEQMGFELQQLEANQYGPNGPAQPSQPAPVQQYSAPAEAQPPQPPVVLILRNGNRSSLNNYAVMGDNLWDFSKQPARKIPLSSINRAASEKATEDAGGEFPASLAP